MPCVPFHRILLGAAGRVVCGPRPKCQASEPPGLFLSSFLRRKVRLPKCGPARSLSCCSVSAGAAPSVAGSGSWFDSMYTACFMLGYAAAGPRPRRPERLKRRAWPSDGLVPSYTASWRTSHVMGAGAARAAVGERSQQARCDRAAAALRCAAAGAFDPITILVPPLRF